MSGRLKTNTTIRPDLGALAYEFYTESATSGFIGLELFPLFETPLKTANFPIITAKAMLSTPETQRAARSAYGRSDYVLDEGDYNCKNHGWEEAVDDEERKLYADYFDAEEIATQRATGIVLRSQEIRIKNKALDTAAIHNGAAGIKWDLIATADPKSDVQDAVETIRKRTGLLANTIAMSRTRFLKLLNTTKFLEAMKYTVAIQAQPFEVQRQAVALYLGIDRLLIAGGIYDKNQKGKAVDPDDIWAADKVVVARTAAPGSKDLKEPCIGRTFLWTRMTPNNITTDTYREDQTESDIYRVKAYTDEQHMFTGAAEIITGLV